MSESSSRVTRVIVLFISLGLCLTSGRTILELWQKKDIVTIRKNELARLREKNADLGRELQKTQDDSYVERVARDKLGMVKEGESIVMLSESGSVSGGERDAIGNMSTWRRWWKLFF